MERIVQVFAAAIILVLLVMIGAALNNAFLPWIYQLPSPFDAAMLAVMGVSDIGSLGLGIVGVVKLATA